MTRWKDFTNKYFYKKYQVETLEWKSVAEKIFTLKFRKEKKKMENTRHRKWKV